MNYQSTLLRDYVNTETVSVDSLELRLSLAGGFQKSISVVPFIVNCLCTLMKPDVDDSVKPLKSAGTFNN